MDSQRVSVEEADVGAVGGTYSKKLNTEDDSKKFKCEPCLFENAEVEATSFCIDCSEHLCNNCAREHRKNKILRSHKLLDGEEIPDDLKAIKMLKGMMACSSHPDVDVTYRCEDHDKFICVTCLAECHRKCNQVNEISEITSSRKEEKVKLAKETLSQLQEYTASSKSASEDKIKILYSQRSDVQRKQQQLFDSIYEQLSQAKKLLEFEMGTLVTKEMNSLESSLQHCKDAELEEQGYQRLLDVTLKLGNAREVNVIPDLISRKVKILRETIETIYGKEQASLKFDHCIDLETFTSIGQMTLVYPDQVKQSDLNDEHRLASDEILDKENASIDMTKPVRENSFPQCSKTMPLAEMVQPIKQTSLSEEKGGQSTQEKANKSPALCLMKCSVSHRGSLYSVRCPEDILRCKVLAIVILPDERLALIDSRNMKLKVFEEDFSLAYSFGFKEYPIDMCHVHDMTVAVAFSDVKSVEMYHIGKTQVSNSRNFPTKFHIVALAKFGNGNEIVVLFSDNQDNCNSKLFIQIRDSENGRILQTFNLEKSTEVALKFEDVKENRMLCRGTNEIFISEYWKFHCFEKDKGSVCTGFQCVYMQESWFYRNHKGRVLKGITDLAADLEGNIYACASKSNNIHQISADDFRESRIIVNCIKTPLSISVNSKKGYIVVGCEDDDFIHVYTFI